MGENRGYLGCHTCARAGLSAGSARVQRGFSAGSALCKGSSASDSDYSALIDKYSAQHDWQPGFSGAALRFSAIQGIFSDRRGLFSAKRQIFSATRFPARVQRAALRFSAIQGIFSDRRGLFSAKRRIFSAT